MTPAYFHTGLCVPDLGAAMDSLGRSGIRWSESRSGEGMEIWSEARGLHRVDVAYVYSCDPPHHFELLQGSPGSIWDAAVHGGPHHFGAWADDLPTAVRAAERNGWRPVAAQRAPDDGYGAFVYLEGAAGVRHEFVSTALRESYESWWHEGRAANDA